MRLAASRLRGSFHSLLSPIESTVARQNRLLLRAALSGIAAAGAVAGNGAFAVEAGALFAVEAAAGLAAISLILHHITAAVTGGVLLLAAAATVAAVAGAFAV